MCYQDDRKIKNYNNINNRFCFSSHTFIKCTILCINFYHIKCAFFELFCSPTLSMRNCLVRVCCRVQYTWRCSILHKQPLCKARITLWQDHKTIYAEMCCINTHFCYVFDLWRGSTIRLARGQCKRDLGQLIELSLVLLGQRCMHDSSSEALKPRRRSRALLCFGHTN